MARTINAALIILGLVLLAVAIFMQFYAGYFGDKLWEVLYARMWLGGRHFYSGLFPVSPPLIFWLYALPAWLSTLPGMPGPIHMLVLLGLGAVAFSILLCLRMIALHPGFGERKMRVQFAALLCFVLVFTISCSHFLDREHLFFVLIFPYMLRFMPELARAAIPRRLSLATGTLAALGFCLKPHFLIVLACIQLLVVLRERSLRALWHVENGIVCAGVAFYALLIWICAPDYFTTVVPMALATYSAVRDTLPVTTQLAKALWVLLPAFLMFRPRQASVFRGDIFYLAGLCLAFILCAMTGNNWNYTYLPLGGMAFVLTGFMLWEFLAGLRQRLTAMLGMGACLSVFAIKGGMMLDYYYHIYVDPCHENIRCQGDNQIAAELYAPGHPLSFGTISIDFTRWTRLEHYTGATWETRFPQLWMLPKFFLSDQKFAQANGWILNSVAEAFADDMNNRKPDIMFVDDTELFYTAVGEVDLASYFSHNPYFRDAFTHYHLANHINLCPPPRFGYRSRKAKCSYYVYRRND